MGERQMEALAGMGVEWGMGESEFVLGARKSAFARFATSPLSPPPLPPTHPRRAPPLFRSSGPSLASVTLGGRAPTRDALPPRLPPKLPQGEVHQRQK
jgi:hypothetical protein